MNPVVHFEIPFDDEGRAKAFYADTFGWNVMDWPLEDGGNYVGVQTCEVGEDNKPLEKGMIGGGMVPRSMASTPVLVINVPDIEAAVEKVKANGGSMTSEITQYDKIGLIAYVQDTEGNAVGLWQDLKKDNEN